MKFSYAYKTSDGTRHEAEIEAATREEVFQTLRERGVRAIKVVAHDGSKANGEVRRFGRKRTIAVWGLSVALLVTLACLAVVVARMGPAEPVRQGRVPTARHAVESQVVAVTYGDRVAKPRPRKQLAFKAADNERELAKIFAHPSEVFLVRFASPGRPSLLPDRIEADLADDFHDALEDEIVIRATDPKEVIELKQIVAGLKEEARMMLASGKDFGEIVKYFSAQEEMEARYRQTIISGEGSNEQKNKLLTALGLQPVE